MKIADIGTWAMAVAALASLALSAVNYVAPYNGIHGSAGALLVIVSSALILVGAVLLAVDRSASRALTATVAVLLLLGILGTGLAAYFLEADMLVALMVVAMAGWLGRALAPRTQNWEPVT